MYFLQFFPQILQNINPPDPQIFAAPGPWLPTFVAPSVWHEAAIIWHILRPGVPKDLGHLFLPENSPPQPLKVWLCTNGLLYTGYTWIYYAVTHTYIHIYTINIHTRNHKSWYGHIRHTHAQTLKCRSHIILGQLSAPKTLIRPHSCTLLSWSLSLLCPRLIAHHGSYTHGAHAREIRQIDYLRSTDPTKMPRKKPG